MVGAAEDILEVLIEIDIDENNNDNQSRNAHIIFGLYNVYSTIMDIAAAFGQEQAHSPINIGKSFYKESNKITELYLDRLEKDERYKVTEESSFESSQQLQDSYSGYENYLLNIAYSHIEPLMENLEKISEVFYGNEHLIKIIKMHTPSIANLYKARLILDFPSFVEHYDILCGARYIEEGTDHLIWTGSVASLADYFHSIYKQDEKKKKERMPWSDVEKVFGRRDLKNSFSNSQGNSIDFMKIKDLLKEKYPYKS